MIKHSVVLFFLFIGFTGLSQHKEFKQKISKKGDYYSLRAMDHAAPFLFVAVSTSSADKIFIFDTKKNQQVEPEGFFGEPLQYFIAKEQNTLLIITNYSTDKEYNSIPGNCFIYDLTTLKLRKRVPVQMNKVIAVENGKIYGVYFDKLTSYSLTTGDAVDDISIPLPSNYRLWGNSSFSKGYFTSVIDSSEKKEQFYWLDVASGKHSSFPVPDSFKINGTVAISNHNTGYYLLKKQTENYERNEARLLAIDLVSGVIKGFVQLSIYPSELVLNAITGEVLVLGSSSSEVVEINSQGELVSRIINAGGKAASWTPDGNSIVFTDYDKLYVYDLNMAQEHMKIEKEYNGSFSFMELVKFFDKDRIYFADNNNDDNLLLGELKLDLPARNAFDLSKLMSEAKKEKTKLPELVIQDGHQTKPTDIAFSAVNNRMITGDEAGNIIIWDADSKMQWNKIKLRKKNSWDENSLMKLAVHPQYEVIAASWTSGVIYFVDFYGNELYRLQTDGQSNIVHFSEDGKHFFYEPTNGTLNVLRIENSKVIASYPFNTTGTIYNYAFNKTSSRIALPDNTGKVEILDAFTGKTIDVVNTVHENKIRSVAFHPSGKAIATLDELFNICVTDIEKKKSNNVISSKTERAVWQVLFDAKGNLLVPGSVGNNGTGSSYNILAGKYDSILNHIRDWTLYKNTDNIEFFSKLVTGRDARTLWSAHTNNAIEIWDAEQQVHIKTINGNDEQLTEVYPGQDFNGIITSTSGNKSDMILKKWNFSTAEIKPYDAARFGGSNIYYNTADSSYYTNFLNDIKKISLQKDSVISSVEFDLYGNRIGNTAYGAVVNAEDKLWLLDPLTKKKKLLYALKKDEQPDVRFDRRKRNLFFSGNKNFIAIDILSARTIIMPNIPGIKGSIRCFDVLNDTIVFADNTNIYAYQVSKQRLIGMQKLSRPAIFENSYYPPVVRISNGGIVSVFYQVDTMNINDKRSMVLDIFRLNNVPQTTNSISRMESVKDIMYSKDEQYLYIIYNKEIEIWDIGKSTLSATVATLPRNRFIIYTPDNFYFTSQKLTDVGFRVNNKVYDISQFDLSFNRPDIVLQRIGYADSSLVSLYRNAYEKRKTRSGSKEINVSGNIPEISINNRKEIELITSKNIANLFLSAKATGGNSLSSIFIYINDVPITGMNGKPVNKTEILNENYSLILTEGINKIKIYVTDNKGVASLKENLEIIYRPAQPEKGRLYFIGMGVSGYKDSAMDLTYADKDIKDLDTLFRSKYKDAISVIMLNNNATTNSLKAVKQTLLKTNEADMVVVSLSGHGLLNKEGDFFFASHETDFNAPEQTAVAFSSLEWLLDSIPARKKLLLIDACHSGEVDRSQELLSGDDDKEAIGNSVVAIKPKGVTIRKKKSVGLDNSFSLMQELFNDLGNANGTAVISAAGGLEFALETAEYQNGVFTYALITGLKEKKADINADGSITIQEIKSWLSNEVFRLTKGRQKPTSRAETIDNNWVIW
jgi:WD40 repeat protein